MRKKCGKIQHTSSKEDGGLWRHGGAWWNAALATSNKARPGSRAPPWGVTTADPSRPWAAAGPPERNTISRPGRSRNAHKIPNSVVATGKAPLPSRNYGAQNGGGGTEWVRAYQWPSMAVLYLDKSVGCQANQSNGRSGINDTYNSVKPLHRRHSCSISADDMPPPHDRSMAILTGGHSRLRNVQSIAR